MDPRLTFVHASDLHIDRQIETNGFSFIGGFKTHDIQLCVGFAEAIQSVRADLNLAETELLHFAVSGDLTANGRAHDFVAAHTYLRAHWRRKLRGLNTKVGLELHDDLIETVPGNHDHWDGKHFPARAYRPRAIAPHFRRTPWSVLWTDASRQLELELFGIDSNSGLTGPVTFGQGSIAASEFAELERLLMASPKPKGVTRVRTVMLHHSPSYRHGSLFPRVISPLVLEKSSVNHLVSIAQRHSVTVLLTGHTHDAGNFVLAGPPEVRELRSPTALQGPAVKLGAGFFVHQIHKDRMTHWDTWHYVWDGGEFRPNPPHPLVQFAIP